MALHLLGTILLIASTVSSVPLETRNTTEPEYRLPTIVVPIHYQVHLNLSANALTENSSAYTGEVLITFTNTQVTDVLKLHAAHDFITINSVSMDAFDFPAENVTLDNVTDILTLQLGGNIAANFSRTIFVNFTGQLSTSDMYGFYKSSYVDARNVTRYLATTQFQPTYARRAFPCFDEPSFKATFDIWITFPEELSALGNTPGTIVDTSDLAGPDSGTLTIKFDTTPVMSTYLLAFIVSNFTCTEGEYIEDNNLVPYQVCSREESQSTRDFAVEIGPRLLRSLNEYTGFNYSQGVAKLDQVAIPDFAAGAMENWGLVTYRETLLLWDRNHSSNRDLQNIATVISHEFGHMWFGNLVTMRWWSETFLNEGLASFCEYFTTHDVLPEWELDKQFVVNVLQNILQTDALETALPLYSEVSSPAEVMSKFGAISYSKGASIFRMLEHAMGSEHFRAGLQSYLQTHQYSNTVPDELWTSLNASIDESILKLPADDISTIMSNWVNNPGFPLLTVAWVGVSVVVSQERYLLSGSDTGSRWYVPVSYTYSTDTNKFNDTAPQQWLTPVGIMMIDYPTDAEWVILNNLGTGYYRVDYGNLWDNISLALQKEDFDGIHELNRAQIADDAFNLARISKMNYSDAFNIIKFLANDTSYYPWVSGLNGFNYLIRRVGLDSLLGQAIANHVLELMANLYESVPITSLNDTQHVYTLKQVLTLTWACRMGHGFCINHVLERFGEYRITNERPDKNLRSVIYCNALRYGVHDEDWDLLWNAYQETDIATEKVTLLSALGCTRNESVLENYLLLSISENSGIRPQDALSVFSAVYNGNPIGIDVAFKFLIENHETIAERYQSLNSLSNIILGIAERFTTQTQIDQLENFIETGNLPEEFRISANRALEIARANLAWMALFEDDLLAYYDIDPNATTSTSTTSTTSSPPTTLGPDTTPQGDGAEKVTTSLILVVAGVFLRKLLF